MSFCILLIEDATEYAEELSAAIKGKCEAQIDIIEDGDLVLKAICRAKYNLIITDGQMPHLNGEKVVDVIRLILPNVFIIAHSSEESMNLEMEKHKANCHFNKSQCYQLVDFVSNLVRKEV